MHERPPSWRDDLRGRARALWIVPGDVARTDSAAAGSPLGALVFVLFVVGIALMLDALVTLRPQRHGLDVDAVHLLVEDTQYPMQVMISYLEVLRGSLRGEYVHDAEAAFEGVMALRRMTSLLDVSRPEAGRMSVRRTITDLSAVAHDVVASVRVVQPTFDIAVETRGDPLCGCDPDLSRRTIENLVINAMLVTAIGGRVRLVIACRWARASITVADERPTIPSPYRTRIFEPYRADRLQCAAAHESSSWG